MVFVDCHDSSGKDIHTSPIGLCSSVRSICLTGRLIGDNLKQNRNLQIRAMDRAVLIEIDDVPAEDSRGTVAYSCLSVLGLLLYTWH